MANALLLLHDMCRLCLDAPGTDNVYNQKVIEDIFNCTGILQISRNDDLPQKICKNCIYKMEAAKDLRNYAAQNDLYMRNILSKETTLRRHEFQIVRPRVSIRLEEEEEEVSSSTGIRNENPSHSKKQDSSNVEKSQTPRIAVRSLENINAEKSVQSVSSSKNDQTPPKEKKRVPVTNKKRVPNKNIKETSKSKETNKCDICRKTYLTPKKLYLHKRTHSKSLHCQLDNCGKTFATKGDLQKHVRSHTGEKPYQCDLCDKRFTQNGSLKAHKITIHDQET